MAVETGSKCSGHDSCDEQGRVSELRYLPVAEISPPLLALCHAIRALYPSKQCHSADSTILFAYQLPGVAQILLTPEESLFS